MKGNILVVDDEPDVERLVKQRFRHEIREGELEFFFAQDGELALEVLRKHLDIDIVLTDINMPRMDGLTLLSHVHEINPIARTIVVSAYGDMDNIRTSMNRGAFDFVVKPINFEDLRATMEKTLQYVAQIREALNQNRENKILRMYVNPSIVNHIKDQKHTNQRIQASVMFVDICSFTRLAESCTPDLIAKLLNTYFDEIALEVLVWNGSIDKFIGDAALIVFDGDNHEQRAAKAAFGIQNRISGFVGRALGEDQVWPDISIGLNFGEMISGNFGSSTISRLDFTVIGDVVNTAARLQSIAKPGEILVGPAFYERTKDAFSWREIGEVSLKNKTHPMIVRALIG